MATENIDPTAYKNVLDSLYGPETYNAWERQRTVQGQVIGQLKQFGQGTWDAGEGVKGFSKAVSMSLSDLNPKLKGLGKIVELVGITAGEALKQNKKLLDDYRRLSDSGNLMIGGFDELNDSLNKVGLAAGEADKLIYALAPATKELVAFGGSVSSGRKKLLETMSGLIGYGNEYEGQLRRLGYTQDQIREGTSQYIALQTQMGLSQGKTAAQLSKESFNYMTTLKELQELTGMSRDEAAKEVAEQQRQLRLKMYLADIEDDTTRQNTQAMIAYVKQTMGPEAAKGYIDMLLNKGAAYTPEAIALQRTMPGIFRESQDAIKKGTSSFVPMMVRLSKQAQAVVNQFGKQQFMIQEGNLRGVLAYDALSASYKFRNMTEEEQTKAIAEMTAATKTSSEGLENANELERMQRRNKLILDEALYKTTQSVVTGFVNAVKETDNFTSSVADAADQISRFLDRPLKLSERHFPETAKRRQLKQELKDELKPIDDEIKKLSQEMRQGKVKSSEIKESQQRIKELKALKKSIEDEHKSSSPSKWDKFKQFIGLGGNTSEPQTKPQTEPQTRSISPKSGTGSNQDLAGLKIWSNSGDTHREGSELNPKLVALMHQIQNTIPGFSHFTGINDKFHANDKNSDHPKGRAADFVLSDTSPENRKAVVSALQSMGLYVKDEYANPSVNATAGHMHVSYRGAALGGLFSGPNSGYPVMLHGKNESVWNEKQIQGLVNDVKQTSIESYKQELISKNVTNNSFGGDSSMIVSDIMKVLTDRLDEVVSNLSRGNRIQEEILVQAKI